jgi:hypothetical protein
MAKKNIHTVYNSGGEKWKNKEEGVKKAVSSHRKKDPAVGKGAQVAKKKRVEHLIHGKKGKIQSRNSYGNDPFPPRG